MEMKGGAIQISKIGGSADLVRCLGRCHPEEGGRRGHARRTRTVDKLAAGVSSFSCPTAKAKHGESVFARVSDH
jgi:hypothetical protein